MHLHVHIHANIVTHAHTDTHTNSHTDDDVSDYTWILQFRTLFSPTLTPAVGNCVPYTVFIS